MFRELEISHIDGIAVGDHGWCWKKVHWKSQRNQAKILAPAQCRVFYS